MAITLVKKKVVSGVKPAFETSTPSDIVALLEELGAMQAEAEAQAAIIKAAQVKLKPFAEKQKELIAKITAHYDAIEVKPDEEKTEESEHYLLQVGKKANEREVVDLELAMKRMGKQVFFQKASITLTALDQYLTPEEKVGVVETKRGNRSIKIVRKAQPQTEAA